MYRILMNGSVIDRCNTYGQALSKAKKIKALFSRKTFPVIIESSTGFVMDTL